MTIFKQHQLEQRVISEVATARGCTSRPEPGNWPDGWIVCGNAAPIPAEVVSAFPDQPGAPSGKGAAWARGYSEALRQAEQLRQRTGESPSLTVHEGRGMVLTNDRVPPAVEHPRDPVAGILDAITGKTRRYGVGVARGAILVVHHIQHPWRLDVDDVCRIAIHAATVCAPFREIWVVNEYGDPAQRAV